MTTCFSFFGIPLNTIRKKEWGNAAVIRILGLTLFIVSFHATVADVRLPSVIGHHMALQQESEVNIWGWGQAAGV